MSETPDTPSRPGASIWLTLAALAGTLVLIGLGAWQLQRMGWKAGILERIEARRAEAPVTLAAARERYAAGEDVRFLRVALGGRFDPSREVHLYAISGGKPGWRIISPLTSDDGTRILVDRGFVPLELEDPAERGETETIEARFTGQVRTGETQGLFVPDNDTDANEWYWRDIAAMASGDADMQGFMVEALEPTGPGAWPRPEPLRASDIPNRHFEYALTWFGLALALVGVYAVFRRSRGKP